MCVVCRLDDEPRGSSEGGKRNRHLFDLLVAGNAPTVARGHGQHHPARVAKCSGPESKVFPMFRTAIRRTAAERMKIHWSALRQSTSSQRWSGDHARPAKVPAPEKTTRRRL